MANVNARRVEEILTSGITAGHYVAGSNITITENQDGTETIASTGGGGGGGFTPTETQLAAMNSGITSNKVSNYDAIVGQMETFYPKLLDVGTNVGEITAEDLDNLHSGIYEYLGMFTGSTLPTELSYKTGVVRGYFTQESMAWNVQFQMVETTDGIFGARTYNGSTWSNWVFNVPGGGGTAPTAYTAVTYDTTYVDNTSTLTHGGYVVVNNICTVNLSLKLKAGADGTAHVVATGIPKAVSECSTLAGGTSDNLGYFTIATNGRIIWKSSGSTDLTKSRQLNISYLVDTST